MPSQLGLAVQTQVSSVPGLHLHLESIALAEEAQLVSEFSAWSTGWERPRLRPGLRESRREMRCFGWRYVTTGRGLEPAEAVPASLLAIRDRCALSAGLPAAPFGQVIVTRYEAGAGIGWHSDAPVFGPVVMTLSLLSDCPMDFDRGQSSRPAPASKSVGPRK
jgi:alkylated DNA repair dioxygenase AlkB